MLNRPSFIPIDQIRVAPLTYKWDHWDPYAALPEGRGETVDLLSELPTRLVISYAIVCAEWTVWRLADHLHDKRALDYLEACWAFVMSKNIVCPDETKETEWQGDVLAPIELSLVTIVNAVRELDEGQAEFEAGFAETIPSFVLADSSPFESWRAQILPRLKSLRLPRQEFEDEQPLPREIFDPLWNYTPAEATKLISAFLAGTKGNPYIIEMS